MLKKENSATPPTGGTGDGASSGIGNGANSGSGARAGGMGDEGGTTAGAPKTPASSKKTTFFGTVEIDPIKAKLQFSDVADEVLLLFTQRPGIKIRISLDIEAEALGGFDDGMQRSVRENCKQLKFKNNGFDE